MTMIQRVYDVFPRELADELLELGQLDYPWLNIVTENLDANPDGSYGRYRVEINVPELPPMVNSVIDLYRRYKVETGGDTNDWAGLLAASLWMAHGPKVARPDAHRCRASQNIELRLKPSELAMPFPEVLVEFPRDADWLKPFTSVLVAVVKNGAGSDTQTLICDLISEGHLNDIVSVCTDRSRVPGWTIEDTISRYDVDLQSVRDQARDSLRIAINVCLMLSGSYSCLLPEETLSDRRLASENSARGEKARRRLRLAVQVAAFDQLLEFSRACRERRGPGDPTGQQVSPHWRRGHWRMQACGVNRGERKRILIPPVMVRKDLFTGEDSDTGATYR